MPEYIPIKDSNGSDICPKTATSTTSVPNCTDEEIYRMEEVILKQLNQFNLEYSNYRIFVDNNQHRNRADGHAMYDYIDANGNMLSYNNVHNEMSTKFGPIANNVSSNASNLPSYAQLNKSLNTYNMVLTNNHSLNPDPKDATLTGSTPAIMTNNNSALSNRDPTRYLKPRHAEITKLRTELDQKLMELNNTQNSMYGSGKLQMDASIYVTILWTTLASAIVYYSFFHL